MLLWFYKIILFFRCRAFWLLQHQSSLTSIGLHKCNGSPPHRRTYSILKTINTGMIYRATTLPMTSITDILGNRSRFLFRLLFLCCCIFCSFCCFFVLSFVCSDTLLFLATLFVVVSSEKELQKEEEIASVHDKGGRVVFFFDSARWIRLVVVKSSQCDGHSDNHLRNLENRNNDGVEPLGAHLHGHQKVVSVHRGMNTVVHDDKENTGRRGCHVRMVAV